MHRIFPTLLVLVSLGGFARAALVLSVENPGVQASQVAGVTTESFDGFSSGLLTVATGTSAGTLFPFGVAEISPANIFGGGGGSGNYLLLFFETAVATLNLPGPQAYLGFWWSASDPGNSLEFYSGGSLLGSFDATTTLAGLGPAYHDNPNFPGQVPNEKFVYLNFIGTGGTTFDQVVFRNTLQTSGFEIDNLSIRRDAPDPIPGTIIIGAVLPEPSTLVLVSLGGLALCARGRRRTAADTAA